MSEGFSQLLSMQAPLQGRRIQLHFLEPRDCCRSSLLERLNQGTYDKPFIIDRNSRRFLHFDLFTVQSAMNLRYPDLLSLAYTRKMMAFLLFNPTPARILLLGLGGGSLAKFCYRCLPDTQITAVEVNPRVIALREAFRIPADDGRFQVVCEEGAAYVADRGTPRDVSNLCVDMYDNAEQIRKICKVFGTACVTLQVKQDGNVIALAFKAPRPSIHWPRLEAAAIVLKGQFGLDFPRYVRRAQQQRQYGPFGLVPRTPERFPNPFEP